MSSRSIISSSLGCKCSFDHSLHFVSIYPSQDSLNLKQQPSKTKRPWAPSTLPARRRGGVWCLGRVCFLRYPRLNVSKLPRDAAPNGQRKFSPSQDRHRESGTPSACRLLQALRCSGGREQAQQTESSAGKAALTAPGAAPQPAEGTETNRPLPQRARDIAPVTGLTNSLRASAAAFTVFGREQERCSSLARPAAERSPALPALSSAATSKNSLAPSSSRWR